MGRSILAMAGVVLLGAAAARADLHRTTARENALSGLDIQFIRLAAVANQDGARSDGNAGARTLAARSDQGEGASHLMHMRTGVAEPTEDTTTRSRRALAANTFSKGLEPLIQPVAPVLAGGDVVQELPSLPGSVELFCTGLLSLGAWQLARSSRQFGLTAIPAWYFGDELEPIGAVVSPLCEFAPLTLCVFDRPVADRPIHIGFAQEQVPLLEPQFCLPGTGSRAPPAFSF